MHASIHVHVDISACVRMGVLTHVYARVYAYVHACIDIDHNVQDCYRDTRIYMYIHTDASHVPAAAHVHASANIRVRTYQRIRIHKYFAN